MAMRLRFGEMLGAGTRAVARYTGTLFVVFIAQTIVAVVCMLAIWFALAQAFSHLPMWDDAVDGDLISLLFCLRFGEPTFGAVAAIAIGALFMWQVVSWFLVGGIHGVLAQRPEGRGDTARAFGASGASTFLAYARLALCSLPGWIAVASLLLWGLNTFASAERLKYVLTVPQLAGMLILATLPAALLLHIVWTITDYARVELSLRHDTHEPSVVMTYLRTVAFVLRRPLTLAHGALGWLAFFMISVGYAYLAQGHPMYGAEGAVTLFVIRQGVALARAAIRFGVLAGQLELGKTRALPPRRVEAKLETKKS
jgi:hypothetical protein